MHPILKLCTKTTAPILLGEGRREITLADAARIADFAEWLANRFPALTLRSGNAPGSDDAFRLFLRTGLFRSGFNPFLWLLFHVPNPAGSPRPFASVEHNLNPSEPSLVSIWRRFMAAKQQLHDTFSMDDLA